MNDKNKDNIASIYKRMMMKEQKKNCLKESLISIEV